LAKEWERTPKLGNLPVGKETAKWCEKPPSATRNWGKPVKPIPLKQRRNLGSKLQGGFKEKKFGSPNLVGKRKVPFKEVK